MAKPEGARAMLPWLAGALSPAAGLASAAAWGAGDFAGGLASRRAPALRIALVVQIVGAGLLATWAVLAGEAFPARRDIAWAALAGLCGAVGVASLYAALAAGRMGIAAPLSGLVAALLPVGFGIAIQGAPGALTLAGFLVAFAGVSLVSAPSAERPAPRVLWLAMLAGFGFAGFLLAISQAAAAPLPWALASARVAAGLALLGVALSRREAVGGVPRSALAAAVLDTLGNAFFLLAARTGRLDVAVVLSSLYPVATVLLARWRLGERLTPSQTLGAALVLLAIPLIAL